MLHLLVFYKSDKKGNVNPSMLPDKDLWTGRISSDSRRSTKNLLCRYFHCRKK